MSAHRDPPVEPEGWCKHPSHPSRTLNARLDPRVVHPGQLAIQSTAQVMALGAAAELSLSKARPDLGVKIASIGDDPKGIFGFEVAFLQDAASRESGADFGSEFVPTQRDAPAKQGIQRGCAAVWKARTLRVPLHGMHIKWHR